MYMLTEVEKVVRIPPAELKEDIASAIDELTWYSYEGRLGDDKQFTVLIKNVRPVGPGRIVHGDGAVYQTVKFEQVVFKPRDNEIPSSRTRRSTRTASATTSSRSTDSC